MHFVAGGLGHHRFSMGEPNVSSITLLFEMLCFEIAIGDETPHEQKPSIVSVFNGIMEE
jgi:hypothetical protein